MTRTENNPAAYRAETTDLKGYAHRPTLPGAFCVCPRCNLHSMDADDADAAFGFRRMKRGVRPDGSVIIEVRVQSHCRDCRRKERLAKAAAKKLAKATPVVEPAAKDHHYWG